MLVEASISAPPVSSALLNYCAANKGYELGLTYSG